MGRQKYIKGARYRPEGYGLSLARDDQGYRLLLGGRKHGFAVCFYGGVRSCLSRNENGEDFAGGLSSLERQIGVQDR
jgi:hypothetical protein